MANEGDRKAQFDFLLWYAEHMEVANSSLMEKSTSLAGFLVLEFGLIAQILVGSPRNLRNIEKFSMDAGTALLLIGLISFLTSLRIKKSDTVNLHSDVLGLTLDEILLSLTEPIAEVSKDNPDFQPVKRNMLWRVIPKKLHPKEFHYGFNVIEELHEINRRRAQPFTYGLVCVVLAQVCISIVLISYLGHR